MTGEEDGDEEVEDDEEKANTKQRKKSAGNPFLKSELQIYLA